MSQKRTIYYCRVHSSHEESMKLNDTFFSFFSNMALIGLSSSSVLRIVMNEKWMLYFG